VGIVVIRYDGISVVGCAVIWLGCVVGNGCCGIGAGIAGLDESNVPSFASPVGILVESLPSISADLYVGLKVTSPSSRFCGTFVGSSRGVVVTVAGF
jgi:hypothetical protein